MLLAMKLNKSGFSLIELLIAAAILVTGLCSILAAYITFFDLISLSGNLTKAQNAAQVRVEQIRNGVFAQIITLNRSTFPVPVVRGGMGTVYVAYPINPNLPQVNVVVSWREKAGRVIGEDANLNGALDPGEDLNGNNMLDSPAEISTIIAAR
jgi:prepilin-type N-terminal cleavage/methylation domain-containing protein